MLVTHQTLLYALSGLPAGIDESLIQKYRKGTFPLEVPSGEEVAKLASLLLETVERSRQDYAEGLFKGFKEYTTSVGITLRSVEDAITFDCFHEGLHLGVIMSLRKVV